MHLVSIRHDDPKTTKHGINQAGRRTYQLGPLSQDATDVGNGARRGCSHAGTVLAQACSDAGVLSMSTCQCIYVNSAWVHLKNRVYMGLYIYGLAFDVSAFLTTDSLCLPSLSGQGQDTRAWDKFGTEKNMISSQFPLINWEMVLVLRLRCWRPVFD